MTTNQPITTVEVEKLFGLNSTNTALFLGVNKKTWSDYKRKGLPVHLLHSIEAHRMLTNYHQETLKEERIPLLKTGRANWRRCQKCHYYGEFIDDEECCPKCKTVQ